jgi:uncharacterized RDD family membrane protein YckC
MPGLFIKRVAAYLIDICLLFATLAPAALLVEKALGIFPHTMWQVWLATVVSFSIPAWLYFWLSDSSRSGATLGKRVLHLKVVRDHGGRVGWLRALVRTAIKLLPWEMAHIFGFALAEQIGPAFQAVGLIMANGLAFIYLVVLVTSRGRRSVHDLVALTEVELTGGYHQEKGDCRYNRTGE